VQTVMNERAVLAKLKHPFVVRLLTTFQTELSLYYVLELARNGEMFEQIQRIGKYPRNVGTFYAAELIEVIEYLHSKNVIHRDLKPENILFDDNKHLKLVDFGTAKILLTKEQEAALTPTERERAQSFVGTAEYVSPEVLNDEDVSFGADIWAFGCILYQMLVGKPPFRDASEYLTFQKILNRELTFPEEVDEVSKDLINRVLVIDASKRLTVAEIKSHEFFNGVSFDDLPNQEPPFLKDENFDDPGEDSSDEWAAETEAFTSVGVDGLLQSTSDQIKETHKTNWSKFLGSSEEIIFTGLIAKRRQPFTKKRQLILTSKPRLFYVDPVKLEVKGTVPWAPGVWAEQKDMKTFFVHTVKRKYYMQGISTGAQPWVEAINNMAKEQFGAVPLARTTSSG